MRNTLRRKQNPYLFLKIGEEREIQESLCVNTVSFKEVQTKKTMNSHKRLRGEKKTKNGFKNCF